MCTDAQKRIVWDQLRQRDLRAFNRWLQPSLFFCVAKRAGISLGQGPLHLGNLVWLALAAASHRSKNFADILTQTLKLLYDAGDWERTAFPKLQRQGRQKARRQKRHKHDPRGHDPTMVSEEAFVQARRKMPWGFWLALLLQLTEQFEKRHGDRLRWKGFRLLALDGTCLNLENWKPLKDHFGTASNGKGKNRRRRVQARLVMLQFPLVRLPWHYELTPRSQDEKTVAARLLSHLHANDLVLMDRGFWSYGLFWQIQLKGGFFAIRQVAQAKLRTVKRLGYKDRLVHYQPRNIKKQWRHFPRGILLRVIGYQIRGFRASAVVTNATDADAISREEWVRLATVDEAGRVVDPGLYHRRWEIETTFRELKVTQGMEGGLRCRTPEGIRFEVAGHVLLYFLVRWTMVEAATHAGEKDALRLSFKHALLELDDLRPALLTASPERVVRVLLPRLLQRIASHRVPCRPGRHYPRPNDTKVKNRGHGLIQRSSKLKKKRT